VEEGATVEGGKVAATAEEGNKAAAEGGKIADQQLMPSAAGQPQQLPSAAEQQLLMPSAAGQQQPMPSAAGQLQPIPSAAGHQQLTPSAAGQPQQQPSAGAASTLQEPPMGGTLPLAAVQAVVRAAQGDIRLCLQLLQFWLAPHSRAVAQTAVGEGGGECGGVLATWAEGWPGLEQRLLQAEEALAAREAGSAADAWPLQLSKPSKEQTPQRQHTPQEQQTIQQQQQQTLQQQQKPQQQQRTLQQQQHKISSGVAAALEEHQQQVKEYHAACEEARAAHLVCSNVHCDLHMSGYQLGLIVAAAACS
jgi:hypothetical protein